MSTGSDSERAAQRRLDRGLVIGMVVIFFLALLLVLALVVRSVWWEEADGRLPRGTELWRDYATSDEPTASAFW